MALATRRNAVKWSDVRPFEYILGAAAVSLAELANTPAEVREVTTLAEVWDTVKRSARSLSLIAESLAVDPKPPKTTKAGPPATVPALPPLVEGGCPVLYRLAVGLADAAGEAARLGSSKSVAFVPGAVVKLAEKVKAIDQVP